MGRSDPDSFGETSDDPLSIAATRADTTLLIGVVSDTHLRSGDELPDNLGDLLAGVDLILHAGDVVDISVVRRLEQIAPVTAVAGNMDRPNVKEELPEKRIVEVGGHRIGLIHGSGPPTLLHWRVRQDFEDVDAIVFGHSHKAFNDVIEDVLVFNPGSLTDKRFSERNSYGIIEAGEGIEATVHFL